MLRALTLSLIATTAFAQGGVSIPNLPAIPNVQGSDVIIDTQGTTTGIATVNQLMAFVSQNGAPNLSNATGALSPSLIAPGDLPVGVLSNGNSAIVGISDTQTLTNKTKSGAGNTFTNIPASAVVSTIAKVFDVLTYGAKCDGVTDDTTSIQSAITAAQTATGTTPYPPTLVVLPPGTCIVNSAALTISANAVSFKGAGMYSTTLSANNTAYDMLNVSGGGYATISDLTIKNFGTGNTHTAINNIGSSQWVIQNVQIGGYQNGLNVTGSAEFTASNIIIPAQPASGIGINFSGNNQIARVLNSIISGTGSGTAPAACIKITGGAAYDLVANELEHCNYSLLVQPSASTAVYSIHSTGNWYDTSITDGVLLDGSASGALITRMSFVGDWFSSSASGSGLELKGVAKGVQITNAQIFANAVDGINIDSGATITGFTVNGSLIAGNTTAGITTNGVGGGTVTGNDIGTSADFGVNGTGVILGSGSGQWTINDNNLAGNTTALTNSSGATTNSILNNNGYQTPTFTVAVTGSGCTVGTPVGTASAGYVVATGGGTCTYVFTFGAGVKQGTNGYDVCTAYDETKGTLLVQSNSSNTSCTFAASSITTSDVIIWSLPQGSSY